MVSNPIEHHIGTFMRTLTAEVGRAARRTIRTGLIAFFVVLVFGGITLTVIIYSMGKVPERPLAELSYAVLVLAALASGAAAAAFHLSIAVLGSIERASRRVVQEIDEMEVGAVRSLIQAAHGGATPGESHEAQER